MGTISDSEFTCTDEKKKAPRHIVVASLKWDCEILMASNYLM